MASISPATAARALSKRRWEGKSKTERKAFSLRGNVSAWPESFKAARLAELQREQEMLDEKRKRVLDQVVEANL